MAASKMFSKAREDRKALELAAQRTEQPNVPTQPFEPKDQHQPSSLWDSLESLDLLDDWASNNARVSIPNTPTGLHHAKRGSQIEADCWLERYIDGWNKEQWEKYAAFDVNIPSLHANIQALNLLLQQGAKLKTLGVACLDRMVEEIDNMVISVLHTFSPSDQEFNLILGLLCICSKFALRIQEHGITNQVESALSFCTDRVERLIENRTKYGAAPLSKNQESTMFTIYCDASSIFLNLGKEIEAQAAAQSAMRVMSETHEDADIFLLNQATLFIAEGNAAAAEPSIDKAVSIAQEAFNAESIMAEKIHVELESLSQALSDARSHSSGLPLTGEIFYVGHQEEGTSIKEEAVYILEKQIAAKREEFEAQHQRMLTQKVKLMRCFRKLGNFHKSAGKKLNLEMVSKCASKMMQLGHTNLDEVPIHDAIGNASFLADYYFILGKSTQNREKRADYFGKVVEICSPVVQKIQSLYDEFHSFERAAEVYEKHAIASMLLKRSAEEALKMAACAVRVRRIHSTQPNFFLARSMVLLSETLAYAGEFNRAIEVSRDGEKVCAEALGELHFKTRAVRLVQGEHKKAFMKIFLMHHAKQKPSNLVVQRISTGAWMDDWLY